MSRASVFTATVQESSKPGVGRLALVVVPPSGHGAHQRSTSLARVS
jgi:hypothetical protein